MSKPEQGGSEPPRQAEPHRPTAFLLAQIGAHAAQRFAERVSELGLSPPDIGLLRMIATVPGRSQRSLATQLGVVPSRVVALIDNLDRRGLVERRRSPTDRRNHELHLTSEAQQLMGRIGHLALEHEADMCAALTADEHEQLTTMLERIAAQQDLAPGVHPGYQRMPLPQRASTTESGQIPPEEG